MTLLDEVRAASAAADELSKAGASARREALQAEAFDKFSRAFDDAPREITIRTEQGEKYDGLTTFYGRITYDDVKFVLTRDRNAYLEIRALLTCPECGREFASFESFYGGISKSDRRRNVERLAAAMSPRPAFRHHCRENILKPLRYAVRNAARDLKVSEWEVLAALQGEEV